MAKKFEFRTIVKEYNMTVLRFDGHDLSIERVYEVNGAWTAPYCEVAKECAENLHMELLPFTSVLPMMAKADWYKNQLFIFVRSGESRINLDRNKLFEVYKRTFGE